MDTIYSYMNRQLTSPSGKTLTIEAIGTFKEDIGKGAYVVLQVKYGLIKLLSTTADLCEQIKEVDMECPIKAGETKITKEVDLPAQIPPVCDSYSFRWGGLVVERWTWGMRANDGDCYRENTQSQQMSSPRMTGRLPVSPLPCNSRVLSVLLSWYKSPHWEFLGFGAHKRATRRRR